MDFETGKAIFGLILISPAILVFLYIMYWDMRRFYESFKEDR